MNISVKEGDFPRKSKFFVKIEIFAKCRHSKSIFFVKKPKNTFTQRYTLFLIIKIFGLFFENSIFLIIIQILFTSKMEVQDPTRLFRIFQVLECYKTPKIKLLSRNSTIHNQCIYEIIKQ